MNETPMASPLSWPVTWPRTMNRRRASHFNRNASVYVGCTRLEHELRLLGATSVIISTNLPLRRDGQPRSDARMPADPGVAVYFNLRGSKRVLACDRWDRVEHNLIALALHIGALRGTDRWGVGSVEQAFGGYRALTETAGDSAGDPWWVVLGVKADADAGEIESAFRRLTLAVHPDKGGTDAAQARLNKARDQARTAHGGTAA